MSIRKVNLASLLLKEYFGEVVHKVGKCLLQGVALPLGLIVSKTQLRIYEVRRALCVLILHNVVTFSLHPKNYVVYHVDISLILAFARYSRYAYFAKKLYGECGEYLIFELLCHGQLVMSDVVVRAWKSLNQGGVSTDINKVKEAFIELANAHFIQRCPWALPSAEGEKLLVPNLVISSRELYAIPPVDFTGYAVKKEARDVCEEPQSKKIKLSQDSPSEHSDKEIFWKVGIDRFHQYFRDIAIKDAVERRKDEMVGAVMQCMLTLSETVTEPWAVEGFAIGRTDITKAITQLSISPQLLDSCLAALVKDSVRFIRQTAESQGGMYAVNFKAAVSEIAWSIVESIVSERFGSKSLRIFRLLRIKGRLEQKQIEEMAMIPARDAKEMTYKMFSEDFLQVQELPRAADHAPSRTLYLFYVELPLVAPVVLELCYFSMANVLRRREMEVSENRRLLEKQQRVVSIMTALKQEAVDEAQLAEIEASITPAEHETLSQLQHTTYKFHEAELQIDDCILMLEIYLLYQAKPD